MALSWEELECSERWILVLAFSVERLSACAMPYISPFTGTRVLIPLSVWAQLR